MCTAVRGAISWGRGVSSGAVLMLHEDVAVSANRQTATASASTDAANHFEQQPLLTDRRVVRLPQHESLGQHIRDFAPAVLRPLHV